MDETTRMQPAGPTFWHRVFGDTPAEMEQAALGLAAEFFGPGALLEVDRRWEASRVADHYDTDKAYTAAVHVRLMETVPPGDGESAAERIGREMEQAYQ